QSLGVLDGQEVRDAVRARGRILGEVRDAALAGADRDVEAEPQAVDPSRVRRGRVQRTPLEERRRAHFAAVSEVPERHRGVLCRAASAETKAQRAPSGTVN